MRLFLLGFLIVSLSGACPAAAQIFSTVEECDVLFGKPIPPAGKTGDVRFYKHDEATIKVLFVENKAAVLTYTSLTSLKLIDTKLQEILSANASGKTWAEVEGEGAKTWQRSDSLAFAIYDPVSGEMNLFSTDYIEKSNAEVQSAINKR